MAHRNRKESHPIPNHQSFRLRVLHFQLDASYWRCVFLRLQLTIIGNRSPAGAAGGIALDAVVVATSAAAAASSTSVDYSSSTSSSSSSANSSPTVTPNSPTPYQRPSTLHGLKHKLHSATKNLHSPNRRKSVGHIPLSPLARTPSPSPLPQSPTRSPSPLTFSSGHQPGSSNTTQSYSPSSNPTGVGAAGGVAVTGCGVTSGGCTSSGTGCSGGAVVKKTAGSSFGRPCKTSEPGSPLLRRALSPDRLHPRTAETKSNSISPLCDPALKVTTHHAPRVTVTTKSPPMCARGLGATAANSPLAKSCTVTTTTTTTTKILHNDLAASTPAEKPVVAVPMAGKNEQPSSSSVTKMFAVDGGLGHVSLPRIAEERDHLQQNHVHNQQQQLMQPTAAVAVDRPKPVKSANGGCRYFFNRKYKHNREQQQLVVQPTPSYKPEEPCKNGRRCTTNDSLPPTMPSTHQPWGSSTTNFRLTGRAYIFRRWLSILYDNPLIERALNS